MSEEEKFDYEEEKVRARQISYEEFAERFGVELAEEMAEQLNVRKTVKENIGIESSDNIGGYILEIKDSSGKIHNMVGLARADEYGELDLDQTSSFRFVPPVNED